MRRTLQKLLSRIDSMPAMVLISVLLWTPGTSISQTQTGPGASACVLAGADSIDPGSSASYTLSPCTADNWTVSCGKVGDKSSAGVTLNFGGSACGSVTITATKAGSSVATKKVFVKPVAAMNAITIANAVQNINYGQIPLVLSAPAATGGNCGGTYTYQWLSSVDNNSFVRIPGATGQSYQPGALTITTFFKRQTSCGGVSLFTANAVTVMVYAKMVTAVISPATQSINPGSKPAVLSLGNFSADGGTFSYQWQRSSNSSFSDALSITGANSAAYLSDTVTATTYYRLALVRGGDTVYSTPASVNVLPKLVAGNLGPMTQTIAYDSIPSLMRVIGVSGGDGNYTYQWYNSPDGNSWAPIDGVWSAGYNPPGLKTTTWYRVAVSSNGVSAASNAVVIKMN